MAEFKLVLSSKDGKSSQKVVKDKEADFFLKKKVGDKVSGGSFGMEGYEFEITGGSDKCGFPMRKGIQQKRQKIMVSGGVGFSSKMRTGKKQTGLKRKRTVCGEKIDGGIVQINLKILKEGKAKLGGEAKDAPKQPEGEKKSETKAVEGTSENKPQSEEKGKD